VLPKGVDGLFFGFMRSQTAQQNNYINTDLTVRHLLISFGHIGTVFMLLVCSHNFHKHMVYNVERHQRS